MKAGVGNKRTYNGLGHRRNTTSTKQKKEKQRAYRVLKSEKLRIQATKDLESTKSIKLAVDAPHVAIVGGGAAGLASLRCLLALGCNVTLFDRVSLSKQKEIIFIFVPKSRCATLFHSFTFYIWLLAHTKANFNSCCS